MPNNEFNSEVLTVSSFLDILNQTLDFAYPSVVIIGEVSSFKINQGKWVFFDLVDSESTVACFMSIYQLKTAIEDGMLVRVTASLRVTKWGKFSLTVKSIELAGDGSVKRAFEILKQKFESEGLFEVSRKRSIEPYPKAIGLITSSSAAAYNDFISTISKHWPLVTISHASVSVQGASAANQICCAINFFNDKASKFDSLVLIRGGGSLDDLQVFNNEDVVRAVYGSKVPIIVAIGHQDDVTLAELAADLRGATPTAAAHLAAIGKAETLAKINNLVDSAMNQIMSRITSYNARLSDFTHVMEKLLSQSTQQLNNLSELLKTKTVELINAYRQKLNLFSSVLSSLNPKKILARGYSIATVNSKVVTDPSTIKTDDEVVLQLLKGKVLLKRKSNDPNA